MSKKPAMWTLGEHLRGDQTTFDRAKFEEENWFLCPKCNKKGPWKYVYFPDEPREEPPEGAICVPCRIDATFAAGREESAREQKLKGK